MTNSSRGSRLEAPSFPIDGALVAVVCSCFGILFVGALALAARVMYVSAYTLAEPETRAALAVRCPHPRVVPWLGRRTQVAARFGVAMLGYVVPLLLCIAWAAALLPAEPTDCWVYGLGVLLVCPAAVLGAYAVGLWRNREYTITGRVVVSGMLALSLPSLLLLALIIQRPTCPASPQLSEFPHTALTAFIMAASLCPSTALIYLSRRDGRHDERLGLRSPFPLGDDALPPVAEAVLTALGFRVASGVRAVLQKLGLLAMGLILLALYTVQVALHTEEDDDEGSIWGAIELETNPSRLAGLYASLTIAAVDFVAWLYTRCTFTREADPGKAHAPVAALFSMMSCRMALILVVGEAYIFLVHAAMLLLLGTLVGSYATVHRFRSSTSQTRALERMVKPAAWRLRHLSFAIGGITRRADKRPGGGGGGGPGGNATAPRPLVALPPFSLLMKTRSPSIVVGDADNATGGGPPPGKTSLASGASGVAERGEAPPLPVASVSAHSESTLSPRLLSPCSPRSPHSPQQTTPADGVVNSPRGPTSPSTRDARLSTTIDQRASRRSDPGVPPRGYSRFPTAPSGLISAEGPMVPAPIPPRPTLDPSADPTASSPYASARTTCEEPFASARTTCEEPPHEPPPQPHDSPCSTSSPTSSPADSALMRRTSERGTSVSDIALSPRSPRSPPPSPPPPPPPPLQDESNAPQTSSMAWLMVHETPPPPPLSPGAASGCAPPAGGGGAATRAPGLGAITLPAPTAATASLDAVTEVTERSTTMAASSEHDSESRTESEPEPPLQGTPEVAFGLVVLLWLLSLLLAVRNDCDDHATSLQECAHPRVRFQDSEQAHGQWKFVLAAGLATIFLVLCFNVYVRLVANAWSLRAVMWLCVATELIASGSGGILFWATDAWTILGLSIFAPPALLLGTHAAHLWSSGRMKLRSGVAERDKALLWDLLGLTLSILAGVGIIYLSNNPQNALFIGFFSFILPLSCAAAAKFYATMRVGPFVGACVGLSVALLAGLLFIFYQIETQQRAAVMLAVLSYPTLLMFVTTMLMWRASYWEASVAICGMLVVSMLLMLAVVLAVLAVGNTTLGLALLGAWAFTLLSVLVSFAWRRLAASGRLAKLVSAPLVALLVIGLLVAGVLGYGMRAFTLVAWVTIGSLLAYAFLSGPGVYSLRAGVLPQYAYHAEGDRAVAHPQAVLAGLLALTVLLLWGVIAAYTEMLTPAAGLSFWAIALLYIYSLDASHQSKLDTRTLCKDLTPLMVGQAIAHAKKRVAERRHDRTTPTGAPSSKAWLLLGDPAAHAAALTFGVCAEAMVLDDTLTIDCPMHELTEFGPAAERQLSMLLVALHDRLARALAALRFDRDSAVTDALLASDTPPLPISTTSVAAGDAPRTPRGAAAASAAAAGVPPELAILFALEQRRWELISFASRLTAHLLLVLRMAAELKNCEQEEAIGEFLSSTKRPRSAAARVALWPHAQEMMVREMRQMRLGLPQHADARVTLSDVENRTDSLFSTASDQPYTDHAPHVASAAPPKLPLKPYEDPSFSHAEALRPAAPAAAADEPPAPHPLLATFGADVECTEWQRAPRLMHTLSTREVALGSVGAGDVAPSHLVRYGAEAEVALGKRAVDEEPFAIALRLVLSHRAASARLRHSFKAASVSPRGEYTIDLYREASQRWEPLTIDDLLPCLPSAFPSLASGGGGKLVPWHVRSANTHELWIPLLHKACAKLAGSYHRLACLSVPSIVLMLTGGTCQTLELHRELADWDRVQLWWRVGCLLICEPHEPSAAAAAAAAATSGAAITPRTSVALAAADAAAAATAAAAADGAAITPRTSASLAAASSVSRPLPSWQAAIAAYEAGNVQLLRLESAALSLGSRLLKRVSSFDKGSGGGRRGSVKAPRSEPTLSFVGLLDLPRACARLHVIRGIHNPSEVRRWYETTMHGTVPCKFKLRATNARVLQQADEAGGGVMISVARSGGECTEKRLSNAMVPLITSLRVEAAAAPSRSSATVGAELPSPASCGSLDVGSMTDLLGAYGPQTSDAVFVDLPSTAAATLHGAVFVVDTPHTGDESRTSSAARISSAACARISSAATASRVSSGVSPATSIGSLISRESATAPLHVCITLLAPCPFTVSDFWTDGEKVYAAHRIEGAYLRRVCARKLKKLQRGEYKRRRALMEIVDVHKRFLDSLAVLDEVWRRELRELMYTDRAAAGGDADGAGLVESIFPSLDTISAMSSQLYERLSEANRGMHPLACTPPQRPDDAGRLVSRDADHGSYTSALVRRLRDALRERWSGESTLRLELVIGTEALDASVGGEPGEALLAELAVALGMPASLLMLLSETPSYTSSGRPAVTVAFGMHAAADGEGEGAGGRLDAQQRHFVLHRRCEVLAAALALPVAPLDEQSTGAATSGGGGRGGGGGGHGGGASRVSARLGVGRVTRAIDRPLGLRRRGVPGSEGRVVCVRASMPLREVHLDNVAWRQVFAELAVDAHAAEGAEAEVEVAEASVQSLARVLRGKHAASVADAFLEFAEYFKIFAEYTSGIDAARSRVDALRKLESGRAALQRCQQDPRAQRADIHNWLVRPNQHIMRQPMLLEQLVSLTPEALPARPRLEAALAKVKDVVAAVDHKKFQYEQKLKLAAVYERLRGDDGEPLLLPNRHLLREGAFIELRKREGRATGASSDGSASSGSDDEFADDAVAAPSTFFSSVTVSRRPTKYVVLCNDSVWYCQLLRGNHYRKLHIFEFAKRKATAAVIRPALGSPPTAFWLADAHMAVLLQPPRAHAATGDAHAWIDAIEGALDEAAASMLSLRMQPTGDTDADADAAEGAAHKQEPELEQYLDVYRARYDVPTGGLFAPPPPGSATSAQGQAAAASARMASIGAAEAGLLPSLEELETEDVSASGRATSGRTRSDRSDRTSEQRSDSQRERESFCSLHRTMTGSF